jgi:hypothetical protein
MNASRPQEKKRCQLRAKTQSLLRENNNPFEAEGWSLPTAAILLIFYRSNGTSTKNRIQEQKK